MTGVADNLDRRIDAGRGQLDLPGRLIGRGQGRIGDGRRVRPNDRNRHSRQRRGSARADGSDLQFVRTIEGRVRGVGQLLPLKDSAALGWVARKLDAGKDTRHDQAHRSGRLIGRRQVCTRHDRRGREADVHSDHGGVRVPAGAAGDIGERVGTVEGRVRRVGRLGARDIDTAMLRLGRDREAVEDAGCPQGCGPDGFIRHLNRAGRRDRFAGQADLDRDDGRGRRSPRTTRGERQLIVTVVARVRGVADFIADKARHAMRRGRGDGEAVMHTRGRQDHGPDRLERRFQRTGLRDRRSRQADSDGDSGRGRVAARSRRSIGEAIGAEVTGVRDIAHPAAVDRRTTMRGRRHKGEAVIDASRAKLCFARRLIGRREGDSRGRRRGRKTDGNSNRRRGRVAAGADGANRQLIRAIVASSGRVADLFAHDHRRTVAGLRHQLDPIAHTRHRQVNGPGRFKAGVQGRRLNRRRARQANANRDGRRGRVAAGADGTDAHRVRTVEQGVRRERQSAADDCGLTMRRGRDDFQRREDTGRRQLGRSGPLIGRRQRAVRQ